jgi:hypothetical protein
MADLLECLLQIKGLRETADRLAALVKSVDANRWNHAPGPEEASAADLLVRLAEIEILHGVWLRLMLASARPALPVFDEHGLVNLGRYRHWEVNEALERFLARRGDNLELLESCSANDLSRTGVHPIRRDMTIADVVALMLATDVERLGEIRRALGI